MTVPARVPLRAAAVALLALASLGLTAVPPAIAGERTAAAPRTHIDPGTLPAGADPALPYHATEEQTIVLPDGRRISTTGATYSRGLFQARGGWLVHRTMRDADGQVTGSRIVFISASGHQRVVASSPFVLDTVSADGRWYVAFKQPPRVYGPGYKPSVTVRAVRVSNGRTISTHTFRGVHDCAVLSVGHGVVVLRTTTRGRGASFVASTVAWNPARRSVRVLARHSNGISVAADGIGSSREHRYTAPGRGSRTQMVDSRTGHVLWSVSGELMQSFSPDDKLVVTADAEYVDDDTPWEMATRIRVRNARTGRLLATFTGQLGAGSPDWAPSWESPTSLLLHAAGEPYVVDVGEGEQDMVYPDKSIVRCSVVTGDCSRVPVPERGTDLLVRTSS